MLLSYLYRAGGGIAVAVSLVAFADTSVGAQTVTVKNNSPVAALQRWVAQIDAHDPGGTDSVLLADAALKPAERALLVGVAVPFASYLRTFDGTNEMQKVKLSPLERALVKELAAKVTTKQSYAVWLHRAVMFETDVAILAPDVTAEAMRDARGTGLTEAIHAQDGELGARNLLNWHFQLARDLIDLRDLRDPSAADPFAASWYHAVALYQLDQLLLAEMAPHVARARQLFPADAHIQFDEACLADAMGSARVQAVMIDNRPLAFRPNVPTESVTEVRASRLFARALELDASFAEPRVRLARLMEKNGKPADALAVLAAAAPLVMRPETEYMSHLIAARANGAVGRVEDGMLHVQAALKLFPTAQSPLVTLSQLALESGDIEGAVAAASRLRANAERDDANDPWWSYFQAAWMGQSDLLDQLRDQVRR